MDAFLTITLKDARSKVARCEPPPPVDMERRRGRARQWISHRARDTVFKRSECPHDVLNRPGLPLRPQPGTHLASIPVDRFTLVPGNQQVLDDPREILVLVLGEERFGSCARLVRDGELDAWVRRAVDVDRLVERLAVSLKAQDSVLEGGARKVGKCVREEPSDVDSGREGDLTVGQANQYLCSK